MLRFLAPPELVPSFIFQHTSRISFTEIQTMRENASTRARRKRCKKLIFSLNVLMLWNNCLGSSSCFSLASHIHPFHSDPQSQLARACNTPHHTNRAKGLPSPALGRVTKSKNFIVIYTSGESADDDDVHARKRHILVMYEVTCMPRHVMRVRTTTTTTAGDTEGGRKDALCYALR